MEHPELRDTVFGEVLAGLLEERGLNVTPLKVAELAEDAGLDGWSVINRMASTDVGRVGSLGGLAARAGVSEGTLRRAWREEPVYLRTGRNLAEALGVEPSPSLGRVLPRPRVSD